jgi:hypothetical protein
VLLRELAGADMNASLVEDVLHCLEYVLCMRSGGGICILLAPHDHFHNFAKLYRR